MQAQDRTFGDDEPCGDGIGVTGQPVKPIGRRDAPDGSLGGGSQSVAGEARIRSVSGFRSVQKIHFRQPERSAARENPFSSGIRQ
jgi:hypothetical protein